MLLGVPACRRDAINSICLERFDEDDSLCRINFYKLDDVINDANFGERLLTIIRISLAAIRQRRANSPFST